MEASTYIYAPQKTPILIDRKESGDKITLTVSVGGTNNLYQWYKNGIKMPSRTDSVLTIYNTGRGVYYCEIRNENFPDLVLKSNKESVWPPRIISGVYAEEYNALIAFYDNLGGEDWNNNNNWRTEKDVDEWYGVTVSGNHVSGIKMYYNNLKGMMPPEIGDLTELTELKVSHNFIGHIPPEIGMMTKLKTLYLTDNELTELPTEIGQLSNLRFLYLSVNQLTSIPKEIGNLASLIKLTLSKNQLTAIPPEIRNLKSLEVLNLGANKLKILPEEIGELENLKTLYLSENELTTIPETIGELSHLRKITLKRNKLTELPPQIGQLANLKILNLASNSLRRLPVEIADLVNLEELYLYSNQLDELPEFSSMSSLKICKLQNNFLDFGDLETAKINAATYVYAPQKTKVFLSRMDLDDKILLSAEIAGVNNLYQWYRNGALLMGETAKELVINSDANGGYYCIINNSLFSNLTLKSYTEQIWKSSFAARVSEDDPFGYQSVNDITIFPNPASSLVNVQLVGDIANPSETVTINLFDVTGKARQTQMINLSNGLYQMEVGHEPAGVYFLHVIIGDKVRKIHKLIIDR